MGPPWEKRQNGYLLQEQGGVSLFYEPHCDYKCDPFILHLNPDRELPGSALHSIEQLQLTT